MDMWRAEKKDERPEKDAGLCGELEALTLDESGCAGGGGSLNK